MDCSTYIAKYLSAHVDGELSGEELRDAEEHLAGCVNCRARFAEERAVKALLRERAALRRTPAVVRGSILAALDAVDAAEVSAGRGRSRGGGVERAPWLSIRRAQVWAPVAIAAVAVLAFVILRGGGAPTEQAIPPFDIAINSYEQFVGHFDPNVKSDTPADISDAYMDHQLPGFVWNFHQTGHRLIGGRVDRLPDGSPVAFTFYRSDTGSILCTYMKSHGMHPPEGELQLMASHHYYRYHGYSICLSYPPGGYICILVTRQSMDQFLQDIMLSAP